MKKKMLWIACVLLALQACKEEKEHPFEGKVYREVVSVAPKIAGRVERLYVSEGEVVNAGDTLAVLEVPEVAAKRQQVEGLLQAADAQYQMALNGATKEQRERVEAQYKAAKEQYELARKTLKRLEALAQDSLIAPQTFDEAFTKAGGIGCPRRGEKRCEGGK
jgi:HlyD family secretion protein